MVLPPLAFHPVVTAVDIAHIFLEKVHRIQVHLRHGHGQDGNQRGVGFLAAESADAAGTAAVGSHQMGLVIPVLALIEQQHRAPQSVGDLSLTEIGVYAGAHQPCALVGVDRSVRQQADFCLQTASQPQHVGGNMGLLGDHQLHRPAAGLSQRRAVKPFHGHRVLAAEASAHIAGDYTHVHPGHAQLHDHLLDIGALEAALHGTVVGAVPPGHQAGTLSGKGVGNGLVPGGSLHHHAALLKSLLRIPHHNILQRLGPEGRAASGNDVVGELLIELGRSVRDGLVQILDCGQNLVLHLDQLRRLVRRSRAGGRDQSHRVAHKPHVLIQQPLLGGHAGDPVKCIFICKNCLDSRHLQSL